MNMRLDLTAGWCNFVLHFRVFDEMFRTKHDMDLKVKKQGGPPFYDLRESIVMIISGHIKEPKVGVEVRLFVKISCADRKAMPYSRQ